MVLAKNTIIFQARRELFKGHIPHSQTYPVYSMDRWRILLGAIPESFSDLRCPSVVWSTKMYQKCSLSWLSLRPEGRWQTARDLRDVMTQVGTFHVLEQVHFPADFVAGWGSEIGRKHGLSACFQALRGVVGTPNFQGFLFKYLANQRYKKTNTLG